MQDYSQSLRSWIKDELKPESLLPGITSGVLIGVQEIVFGLSVASLIFSGELTPYFSRGVGIAIFTAAVLLIGISLTSRVPRAIGGLQDVSAAILAVIISGVVAAQPLSAENQFATIVGAIVLTTLLTGIVFLSLGTFRLGQLVRFIPYPVIGGFLAGTGWLLALGSFGVMLG